MKFYMVYYLLLVFRYLAEILIFVLFISLKSVTFYSVNGDWLCQCERDIFDPLQNRHPSTDH